MKKVLLLSIIAVTLNFGFQCNHTDKCDTLREHIKKEKLLPPNG